MLDTLRRAERYTCCSEKKKTHQWTRWYIQSLSLSPGGASQTLEGRSPWFLVWDGLGFLFLFFFHFSIWFGSCLCLTFDVWRLTRDVTDVLTSTMIRRNRCAHVKRHPRSIRPVSGGTREGVPGDSVCVVWWSWSGTYPYLYMTSTSTLDPFLFCFYDAIC